MTTETLGKYQILEIIGAGGFGTVYRARDLTLERELALKVLHPQLLSEPGFIERFYREAKAAAKLEHPHIVPIYEVGEAEGRHYIAMRLLRGEPLDRLLKRSRGGLPPKRTPALVQDLAAALDYAHARGVVHRDVKPSNIFVTDQGAVLADFGIVRNLTEASRITSTGQAMGTPEYMAPEQILGGAVGPETDVYALGIVAYEMLTGKRPFDGTTPFAIQEGHVRRPTPSVRDYNQALPDAVDSAVARALAKRRSERYGDAGAFAEDLAAALTPARKTKAPGLQPDTTAESAGRASESSTPATKTPQTVAPSGPALPEVATRRDKVSAPVSASASAPMRALTQTEPQTKAKNSGGARFATLRLLISIAAFALQIAAWLLLLVMGTTGNIGGFAFCFGGLYILEALALGLSVPLLSRRRQSSRPKRDRRIGTLGVIISLLGMLGSCLGGMLGLLEIIIYEF